MNILMPDYEYPPVGGGGGVFHELVAEELAKRHRVVVITSGFGDLPRREMRNGVEILRVPVWGRSKLAVASIRSMLTFPPAVWGVARPALRGESFDIVNGQFAVPTGPASLAFARRLGIPHIISVHGGDLYDPSKSTSPHRVPLLRGAVSRVLRGSQRIVANSENTRDNVSQYYGAVGDVDIIRLGIRPYPAAPATREALGLPPDAWLGATVGRLVARKGLDRLLLALARPELDRVHLAIMGSGPERSDLERLAAQLGIGERVRFLGWVEEETKWQVLRSADAFLSATLHEGYGLMFLEAMAVGLPIVAPDHGGHTDFLRDGVTGFLTPAGDEAALAAAISRLVSDAGLADRMSAENRRLFEEEHGVERCARSYEALYEQVLAAPLPGRSD